VVAGILTRITLTESARKESGKGEKRGREEIHSARKATTYIQEWEKERERKGIGE